MFFNDLQKACSMRRSKSICCERYCMAEKIATTKSPKWYALEIDPVLQKIVSQTDGLTQAEAERHFVEATGRSNSKCSDCLGL